MALLVVVVLVVVVVGRWCRCCRLHCHPHAPHTTTNIIITNTTHQHPLPSYHPTGAAEAGIDGGGLFKDLMDELLRRGFDPAAGGGLFAATANRELYPSPAAFAAAPAATGARLAFFGRMLGKAVAEGLLLELPLAGFFLKKFSGRPCDLNDLADLDAEVHRHLLALRHYKGARGCVSWVCWVGVCVSA